MRGRFTDTGPAGVVRTARTPWVTGAQHTSPAGQPAGCPIVWAWCVAEVSARTAVADMAVMGTAAGASAPWAMEPRHMTSAATSTARAGQSATVRVVRHAP